MSSDIVLNFDEAVKAGTGDIVISDGAADIRTITLGRCRHRRHGDVPTADQVVINLANNLNPNATYNVTFAAGVIEDAAGNDHAGLAAGRAELHDPPGGRHDHADLYHPGRGTCVGPGRPGGGDGRAS